MPLTKKPFLQWVLEIEPYTLLLFGFLWGTALVVGSQLLGIYSVSTPDASPFNGGGVRQVGYGAALNWSLTYAVLFPISLYLMAESLRCMKDALNTIQAKGMVRGEDMRPILGHSLTEAWINGSKMRSFFILLFGGIGPALVSIIEWFRNNYLRLEGRGPIASYPDYDWGLAGVMFNWPALLRHLNAGFDFFAFLIYGALLSTSFVYFILLLDLARVLPTHLDNPIGCLIPNLDSAGDKRRGFEAFAEPLQQMLFVALISYVMCYLVRIEGAYLNGTGTSSLWLYIKPAIFQGIKSSKDSPEGISTLFDAGDTTVRGYIAQIATFMLFAFSMQIMVITVRNAAQRARDNVLGYLSRADAKSLFSHSLDSENQRATEMTIWPLGYLTPNLILLVLISAAASIYWFRIGLFVVGLVLITLLTKFFNKLRKLGG